MNYDCDPEAIDNTFERIVNILSKIVTSRDHKLLQTSPPLPAGVGVGVDLSAAFVEISEPITASTAALASAGGDASRESSDNQEAGSQPGLPFNAPSIGFLSPDKEQSLKYRAMESIAAILTSMVVWSRSYSDSLLPSTNMVAADSDGKGDKIGTSPSSDEPMAETVASAPPKSGIEEINRFEAAKHMKQVVREAVRLFNWKCKKGIQHLVENGALRKVPKEIAVFLLQTPGLNKKMIGEYLGEGEEWNISVMHAFVDEMDFTNLPFVSALRTFLQSFRLPGEAQKIDRFMLKFAERFLLNNPKEFTNADCAYVLAYSVIMLNTDLHNPQIKKRMTKAEFLKNNRGINDSKNLPDEYLGTIYDEIANNEIKMKDEQEQAANQKATNYGTSSFGLLSNQCIFLFRCHVKSAKKGGVFASLRTNRSTF